MLRTARADAVIVFDGEHTSVFERSNVTSGDIPESTFKISLSERELFSSQPWTAISQRDDHTCGIVQYQFRLQELQLPISLAGGKFVDGSRLIEEFEPYDEPSERVACQESAPLLEADLLDYTSANVLGRGAFAALNLPPWLSLGPSNAPLLQISASDISADIVTGREARMDSACADLPVSDEVM